MTLGGDGGFAIWPAVVLAVDGFHEDLDPRGVLYMGMSRARDLLIVVAPEDVLEGAGHRRFHRRPLHHERTHVTVNGAMEDGSNDAVTVVSDHVWRRVLQHFRSRSSCCIRDLNDKIMVSSNHGVFERIADRAERRHES